jgi:hypothetical protein
MNLTRHLAGATRYKTESEAKLAKRRGERVFIDRLAVEKEASGLWIVSAFNQGSIRFLVEAVSVEETLLNVYAQGKGISPAAALDRLIRFEAAMDAKDC